MIKTFQSSVKKTGYINVLQQQKWKKIYKHVLFNGWTWQHAQAHPSSWWRKSWKNPYRALIVQQGTQQWSWCFLERSLTSTNGQESNSLVDSSRRGETSTACLRTSTRRTNSGGVSRGTVLMIASTTTWREVLVGEEVDNLKGVLNNADSLELLTVVATVHHQRVGKTFDNGALGLAETLGSCLYQRSGEGRQHLWFECSRSKRCPLSRHLRMTTCLESLTWARLSDKIGRKVGESLSDKASCFSSSRICCFSIATSVSDIVKRVLKRSFVRRLWEGLTREEKKSRKREGE